MTFLDPAARLDFGGYGKGYALDVAARVLDEFGVRSALLHGGTSSILTRGEPEDGPCWRVEIRDPFETESGGGVAKIDLVDCGLCRPRPSSTPARFGRTSSTRSRTGGSTGRRPARWSQGRRRSRRSTRRPCSRWAGSGPRAGPAGASRRAAVLSGSRSSATGSRPVGSAGRAGPMNGSADRSPELPDRLGRPGPGRPRGGPG